ncbi:MAG: cytochrome c oxidase subunit II [Ectothiorhodospiraceae bacterium]|nr:cytochrome c oxidase subunit II [Ectothiorhodospiraceae bacterium]
MNLKKLTRVLAAVGGPGLLLFSASALAVPESDWRRPWGLNLPQGVTSLSEQVYNLHMLVFYISLAIGLFVTVGVLYSVVKFRKSAGAVPAQWHHSTTVEIIWTVIPFLILLFIAIPATQTMIKIDDTSEYDMTVKVTGYQWMWEYEYLDEDIQFFSRLDRDSDRARRRNPEIRPQDVEHYLLNVDNPLVVPVNTRIRFLLTANDVIHAWWVPELGWKKDAIPGFINEAWAEIREPGVYRGQCAELCGRDHAFMPIVVVALEQEDYEAWVAEQRGDNGTGELGEPVGAQPAAEAGTPEQREAMVEGAPDTAADDADTDVAEDAAGNGEDMSTDDLMAVGRQVYDSQCIACHQATGQGLGAAFPALAGNERVIEDRDWVKDVVMNGVPGTAMQAYARLSDEDLAGLLTYITNAWDNDSGEVFQPADIQAAR